MATAATVQVNGPGPEHQQSPAGPAAPAPAPAPAAVAPTPDAPAASSTTTMTPTATMATPQPAAPAPAPAPAEVPTPSAAPAVEVVPAPAMSTTTPSSSSASAPATGASSAPEVPAPTPSQAPPRAETPSATQVPMVGSIKRKREDDAEEPTAALAKQKRDVVTLTVAPTPKVDPADVAKIPQQNKGVIATFYNFLRRSKLGLSIVERTLRQPSPFDDEPPTKRPTTSIADKVAREEYTVLDDLVMDLFTAINDRIAELDLTTVEDEKVALSKEDELAKLRDVKSRVMDQYKHDTRYVRETSTPFKGRKTGLGHALKITGVVGGPVPRPLFTSLAKKDVLVEDEGVVLPSELPAGMELVNTGNLYTKISNLTLGELFPTPANRHRLLPPKPATAKQSQTLPKAGSREILTWHHPELDERMKPTAFSSQAWPCGYFIDYGVSQAPLRARQRERAQSLAGRKPSTSELIVSEHDSLFRQTCLNFAPSFDNSGAIVTARQAAKLHWQKFGQYGFYKELELLDGEDTDDDDDDSAAAMDMDRPQKRKASEAFEEEIDESYIEKAIEKWEDVPVDPALLAMESYEKTEKGALASEEDVDHVLTEISDLILTLESMQYIRESSKPSGTASRLGGATDQDMLTSPASNQTPSAEEVAKYVAAEKRLVKLISLLSPFQVSKLGGDQLNDLLVSTKVSADVVTYNGSLDDDEAAVAGRRREQAARQQQQAAAAAAQRPPAHRTPSAHSPFPAHQHSPHHANNNHYAATNRTPSGTPHQQPFGPGYRSQPHPAHPARPGPGAMPQQPQQAQRPPVPQQHRPQPGANGYTPYVPQLANTQTPYGHQGMNQFPPGSRPTPQQVGSPGHFPGQQHPSPHQQHPPFGPPQPQQRSNPDPRFQQRFPQGFQTPHQPGIPGHAPMQGPFPNGMPQRTASPQVPPQSASAQAYQQRYGPGQHIQGGGSPGMNRPPMGTMMNNANMHGPGGGAYAHMTEEQRQKQRFEQTQGMQPTPSRQPPVVGLAGIGLGVGGGRGPGPRPPMPPGMGMGSPGPRQMPNGLQVHGQPGHKVSPVPRPAIPNMPHAQHGQQMVPPRHHSPMQMQGGGGQPPRPSMSPMQQMQHAQQQPPPHQGQHTRQMPPHGQAHMGTQGQHGPPMQQQQPPQPPPVTQQQASLLKGGQQP